MTEESIATSPSGPESEPAVDDAPADEQPPAKGWWRRSHPTFASLTGFYGGMLFIILVPGLFAAISAWIVGQARAERIFPYALITLVLPLALLVPRKTRRFAEFIWIGIVSTVIVVVGAAALTIWLLIK